MAATPKGSEIIKDWPKKSQEATQLARFDGSVIAEPTAGKVSARCHDEQANFLALNLMHDLVTGAKGVEEARAYYAEEFLSARRKQPTPYIEQLRFQPGTGTPDPDQRVLSDQDLEQAQQEGEQKRSAE